MSPRFDADDPDYFVCGHGVDARERDCGACPTPEEAARSVLGLLGIRS